MNVVRRFKTRSLKSIRSRIGFILLQCIKHMIQKHERAVIIGKHVLDQRSAPINMQIILVHVIIYTDSIYMSVCKFEKMLSSSHSRYLLWYLVDCLYETLVFNQHKCCVTTWEVPNENTLVWRRASSRRLSKM